MTKDGQEFYDWATDSRMFHKDEFLENIRKCLECPYFRFKPEEWNHHKAKCCYNSEYGKVIYGTQDKTGNTGYSRLCPKGNKEEIQERYKEIKLTRAKTRLENFKKQQKDIKEKIKKIEREIRELEGE